ncbi:hypothetical protein FACS1894186_2730 [Alphaproteobacteria bacterium]|nr:hypothetical protein FACS1894186_2730 [Alphaproteobacteria bacterium]
MHSSAIFNKAIEWGLPTSTNPAKGIRAFREKSRDRFLQPDELRRFFSALDGEPNSVFRDYILLSLYLGQRRGNMLAIRWADIDFTNRRLYIAETKNGEPQNVPLPPPALALLQDMRRQRGGAWVFPSRVLKNDHLKEPRKPWVALLQRAGIDNLRIHDLRRTLASYQVMTGATLPVIGKTLGQKTPAATSIYARLTLDPVLDSMTTAIDKMLGFRDSGDNKALPKPADGK